MKLTKTCTRFLRKHGGTILAVAASVGVVATAIETGRATTKAKHIKRLHRRVAFLNPQFMMHLESDNRKERL